MLHVNMGNKKQAAVAQGKMDSLEHHHSIAGLLRKFARFKPIMSPS